MLTTNDIIKLSTYIKEDLKHTFATKEEIEEKFEEQKKSFSILQLSVDGMTKEFKSNSEERVVLGNRMNNAEDWIEKASNKIGLKYER